MHSSNVFTTISKKKNSDSRFLKMDVLTDARKFPQISLNQEAIFKFSFLVVCKIQLIKIKLHLRFQKIQQHINNTL